MIFNTVNDLFDTHTHTLMHTGDREMKLLFNPIMIGSGVNLEAWRILFCFLWPLKWKILL